MSEVVIELKEVSRSFDAGTVAALRAVSLSVSAGERLALVGPSGSGKSTLLHIMGTLDFACSGSVRILGQEISSRTNCDRLRNQSIGFVFQLFHLLPALSLLENVEVALMPRAYARSERRERAFACLQRVGLAARARYLPTQVSGGERQRCAIARALVTEPQIVLADEPTGNLDSKSGQAVLELLESLCADGQRTLVLVTHSPEYAARMGRCLRLCDGQLVQG